MVNKPNGRPICYIDVIVGGGITGITTAYELQKQGKKCLVLEARNLCFGTSGGTTAHLNNFFDTTYAQATSDFGSKGFDENIESLKIDCDYRQMDGIVYAQDDKQVKELDEMYESAIEVGIPVSYVNTIPIDDTFQRARSFKRHGQLHPVKYSYSLARAFQKLGGIIIENCFVKDVSQMQTLGIETSLGTIRSDKLIYATHIPPGVNLLHLRCAPYRSYVMAIELEDEQYPLYSTYDMMDPYHYYRTQEVGNRKFLIAGGEDHKTGHEQNTALPFEKLKKYLRNIFKIRDIKYRWSSQYFESADGLAYTGLMPGASQNIFVATGFGGNGMTYSHIAADVLSETIIHNTDLYDGLFSPGRIKPVAGFSNFIKENVDVVGSLVIDRFKISSLKTFTDIPSNSRDTVKYHHQDIAVYKSAQGELFCLNLTCTHSKLVRDFHLLIREMP